MSFITFQNFIQQQYAECKSQYGKFVIPFPGLKQFTRDYVTANGFNEYLESIKGTCLTENQAYSLAATYVKHGERKSSDIPIIFKNLERYHDITLPICEGILTPEYWRERLTKKALSIAV